MIHDLKMIFPVIAGVEITFWNRAEQQQQGTPSELSAVPSTVILQKDSENDILLVSQSSNQLPAPFAKNKASIAILINPRKIQYETVQSFPDIWNYIQSMNDRLRLSEQLCAIKLTPQMSEVFSELEQIPLPPTMFRFFVQLKIFELLLLLSATNQYGREVHFYPYAAN